MSFAGQVDAAKIDSARVSSLGRTVGGGTWPRLSLSRRTHAERGAARMLELAALDRFVHVEKALA